MVNKRFKKKREHVDPTLQHAYTSLVRAVEHAQSNAPYGAPVDLAEAGRILSAHPQLVRFLEVARERELARQEALTRLEKSKGNPTGSHPQAGMAGWTSSSRNYPQGVPNAVLLRNWADSNEWVRAAINARRQQVERADIAVLPLDEKKSYSKPTMKKVQQLIDQPNELRDSWRSLVGPVLEDVLVLDRGVITKNMTLSRQPVALYYEDGSTIKIYPEWSGDPNEPRYLYEEPGGAVKKPLRNDEAIVISANGATYRFSLSPVQVLRDTIVADIEAMKSGAQMVAMKPPPVALQIPGASDTQIRGMMQAYDHEIAGRKELFLFGGPAPAQHFPLIFSAKDNQWLEWQEYLARKICAIFQISPQQIGLTFDINRATSGTQQQIFEDTGLLPLLLLFEEYLNRELLSDFAPKMKGDRFNLEAINLRIIFPEVSEAARQLHTERTNQTAQVSLAGLPSATLNQILAMKGEEPVKGGNTFFIKTATGAAPWLSYDGEIGDYTSTNAGGQLGAQSPEGGTQDNTIGDGSSEEEGTPNFQDDTAQTQEGGQGDGNSQGEDVQSATKQWHDPRRPGIKWNPTLVQKERRRVPPSALHVNPLDDPAHAVLEKAVNHLFQEAAERGKAALKGRNGS